MDPYQHVPTIHNLDSSLGVDADALHRVFNSAEVGEYRRALTEVAAAQVALDVVTRYAVNRARSHGNRELTWEQIGHALGISKQAAHKRFGAK